MDFDSHEGCFTPRLNASDRALLQVVPRQHTPHLLRRWSASDLGVFAPGDGIGSAVRVLLVRSLRRPLAPLALKLKAGRIRNL